ncbi:interleukin-17F-like isoform X2 [Phyllopteryx taeniolatus]|uniref:interleukin-17F-like isoform X2 n=1 Tax=Phyllopteryx taeniolatus TaxID=161469 RepID=UPI002AD510D0|nr:interleukin-17F-like isoform X2 [Phyllopteryx taeniolatus]
MVAMTMVLMTEGVAIVEADGQSKSSAKAHRKTREAPIKTVALELNADVLVPSETFRPLHNRSISPWTYNVSQDASVFPPVSEARCVFRGCLDSNGVEDLRLESRPILHQVLLLRRLETSRATERRDAHRYRLEPRLVAVGCTCVRHHHRRQQQQQL